MGTINYKTSDYITLGAKTMTAWDYEQDPRIMEEMRDYAEECGCTVEEAILETITTNMEADFENISAALSARSFMFYNVTLEPGYYDGFYLNIENNFPVAFDSWEDKREVQKEITEIKSFLMECAGLGLVAVYPGWCTGYADYNGTIKAIKEAVKEMRAEAAATPTWLWYERNQYPAVKKTA